MAGLLAPCILLRLTLTLTSCSRDPWTDQDLGTEADLRDVFFLDAQRGFVVGGRHTLSGGIIGRTEDGGQTWTYRSDPVHNPGRSKITLNAVRFLDQRTGIIVDSAGRILRTVDGGENWHVVHQSTGSGARLHVGADGRVRYAVSKHIRSPRRSPPTS